MTSVYQTKIDTEAATMQLSVPILAAVRAILFLQEPMTLRLGVAAVAVLSGTALVIQQQPQRKGRYDA